MIFIIIIIVVATAVLDVVNLEEYREEKELL